MESDIKLLIQAKEAYYNTGHPILSDQEYDALEERVKKSYPDHPLFETVGHTPSPAWLKGTHNIFMGSLNKVHSEEEILKWSEKFSPDTIYSLQFKLDGLSTSMDYDIEFISGLTRGDGSNGENISDNIRLMKGFKELLPGFTGSIRAEILLPRKDFERINESLPEKEKYSNPRNAASGISRRLDGKFCKYLQLIAYDITEEIDEDEKINKLSKLGLTAVSKKIGDINIIIDVFKKLKEARAKLPYDIDGAVVKVNSYTIQQECGVSSNRPKAQIAWKFEAQGEATIFLEEVWDVGRTGVITPLALMEPVEIDGSIISKATLHNVAEIKKLGIGRGDLVMLEKRGDIIPKITSVIEHKGNPIKIPTTCPSCNSNLLNDDVRLICPNVGCPKRNFHRIMNWIKVTGIEEFGESLGMKLEDKVKSISDLYNLKEKDIIDLEGWGPKRAKVVISNIKNTRELKPEIFLEALGIPTISDRTSKELLKHFGTIENILEIDIPSIAVLSGFGDTSAVAIVSGLLHYRPEIENLLKIISLSSGDQGGLLSGKSFCFTGSMEQPRPYYQKLVENNGGENKNSVTKDLTYLVMNVDAGSSKSQKAKKYDTKIITEKEFLEMLGEISPEPEKPKTPKIESYSLFD